MFDDPWSTLLSLVPALVSGAFVFAFGACVGSFINVVVYRLPRGMSLRSPPSRCPVCGRRLAWHENLPILGWLLARGRCWSCGTRVGVHYPLVELLVALLFGALYLLLFEVRFGSGAGLMTNPWWVDMGPLRAAPAFVALLAIVGGLVAASLIDAKSFIIPSQITTFMAVTGFAGIAVQAFMPETPRAAASGWWAIPLAGWFGASVGVAGLAGILASCALLRFGGIARSFADYEDFVKPGETFADYPHARREMVRELVFLAPCVAGMTAIIVFEPRLPDGSPPLWFAAVGASALGFIVGGGVLWAIRVLGSLAFGREAMGMGDVHLMAAVGAALGWVVPTAALIPAIFVALIVTFGLRGVALLRGRSSRELPLGPYLAIGVLAILFGRPLFVDLGRLIIPQVIPSEIPGVFTKPAGSGGIRGFPAETGFRWPVGAASPSEIRKGV
ncbi:MAG: prepilin peptidase [Phycisphaeraceae bacterium]|nr:prepilin peptidase [Phycisphaeraceae bacterium]